MKISLSSGEGGKSAVAGDLKSTQESNTLTAVRNVGSRMVGSQAVRERKQANDLGDDVQAIYQDMESLAKRVGALERRLGELEYRFQEQKNVARLS